MIRPLPPALIFEPFAAFVPAEELGMWASQTFIADDAALANPHHAHLQQARIGWLWTTVANARRGRSVIGQCEIMPPPIMGKWAKERAIKQLSDWFNGMPDFVITLDANVAEGMDDVTFCALVEHELYHAGQALDDYGQPKFNRQTGMPVWAIRGHDVEEFIGVVRRYGATDIALEELIEAGKATPTIGRAAIASACGTCLRVAA